LISTGESVAPIDLMLSVRDRLEAEMHSIRERHPLFAPLLDCPVPVLSRDRVRLRPGSHLQPRRGLEMVLKAGWYPPEEWAVWSKGSRAVLQIPLDRTTSFPLRIELELHGYLGPDRAQLVVAFANVRKLATLRFDASRRKRIETVEITAQDVSPDLIIEIAFEIANPTAPADVEDSSDRRKLGVAISGLRIF
jgi:hypothetical protein